MKLSFPTDKEMELKQETDYIFGSKLPDISIPNHLPLHTYCFQNLSGHRARPYLINAATGATISHGEFELAARRVAGGYHVLGIRKSDVVMLLLHNSPEFAAAFLGASLVGAVATTANPLYTASEIALQARISRPKLIITHACYVEKVKHYASESGAKIATIDLPPSLEILRFAELMRSDEKQAPPVEIDADDTAALPFSSGTTGLPKGVMLSHKNLVSCVSQQLDGENPAVHTDCADRVLCVLPMFHVYSMISVMLCCLRAGAAVVIMPKFEINQLMEIIEKYRVTIAPFVPPILLGIAKSPAAAKFDLSSVRRVVCGAAPMDRELELALKSKLPNAIIGQGYGMTEAGVLSMCLGFAKIPFKFKAGSCGTVIRNARMKVVDPATGASLPRNRTGEICIKGDAVMKGYYNNPEATKETIDEEGWLHTGDVGYVDDDGEVFIVDRLKELIKYKGFHIAPAELEALLVAHPSISDAAVVPMADEAAGEVPVAFVVRTNGANIPELEIKKYIAEQVAPYKRINRIFFTDEIPKAPTAIQKLLQHGYSINATVRPHRSGVKRDLSFLTNLPGARDGLQIFEADFENPESFEPAIEGCVGVFHVAHPIDLNDEESEETVTKKSVEATLSILRTCLKSKTVKKVVYTSSLAAVMAKEKIPPILNEDVWSDVDFLKKLSFTGRSYGISKTETERAVLEFAEKNPIELVTLIPSWIHGPFVCPNLPGSVHSSLALFLGNENRIKYQTITPMVHVDDVASAHVFLFECAEAKGRYLCSAVEVKYDDLCEFVRGRYPQFEMLSPESLCDHAIEFNTISSKKLLDTGFRYKYGLEEMYDEAIECCKEKGFL